MSDEGLYNPPAQRSLAYRIGTQRTFFAEMLREIPAVTFASGLGAHTHPLAAFTARDLTDPTIALIHAWSMVGEIVAFYQERIINEGNPLTAIEARSLELMARGLGYRPEQFIAAAARVAVTVDDTVAESVGGTPAETIDVPAGATIQSVPPPGATMQTFETARALTAAVARNAIGALTTRPQLLDPASTAIDLADVDTGLEPGDSLLLTDSWKGEAVWLRVVLGSVTTLDARGVTRVSWAKPLGTLWDETGRGTPWPFGPASAIFAIRLDTNLFGYDAADWATQPYLVRLAATPPGYRPQDFKTWPGFAVDLSGIDLPAVFSEIVPGSVVLVEEPTEDVFGLVEFATTVTRTDFGLSSQVTRLSPGPLSHLLTRRSLTPGRQQHTATLLPNGTVLIVGGCDPDGDPLANVEIYHPATGAVTFATPMPGPRCGHTTTLLADNTLLVVGGTDARGVLDTALICPLEGAGAGQFQKLAATLATARSGHTATLVPGAGVLIAGGFDAAGAPLASAQVYDPAARSFGPQLTMQGARAGHTATAFLAAGQSAVLLAGGTGASGIDASAEVYLPSNASFTATNQPMPSARTLHAATLVPGSGGGAILLTGGEGADGRAATPTTLIFAGTGDPVDWTFTTGPDFAPPRWSHASVPLQDGTILIAGGQNETSPALSAAAIYQPGGNTIADRAPLPQAQTAATATLLPSGLVLLVGGRGTQGVLDTADPYDPYFHTFRAAGSLSMSSGGGAAALLDSKYLLLTGGWGKMYLGPPDELHLDGITKWADLYDPFTQTFSATGPMNTARMLHTATLLDNGSVLVAGGILKELHPNVEKIIAMLRALESYVATLLPVASDIAADASQISTQASTYQGYLDANNLFGEIWVSFDLGKHGSIGVCWSLSNATDPSGPTNNDSPWIWKWNLTYSQLLINLLGYLPFASTEQLCTDIENLATGAGQGSTQSIVVIEQQIIADIEAIIQAIKDYAGGPLLTAELYNPATAAFSATSAQMIYARNEHTATLLPDGRVLLVAGSGYLFADLLPPPAPPPPSQPLSSAELYDPGSGEFTLVGSALAQPVYGQSATLLSNGLVLVAGGTTGTAAVADAALYDPATDRFMGVQALNTPRARHTATLLTDGTVLIAGGIDAAGQATNQVEIFRPDSNGFAPILPMKVARAAHCAVMLPDGSVLIAGGYGFDGQPVASAEIFNAAVGAFTLTNAMNEPRAQMMVARLPGFGIVVAGGYADGTGAVSRRSTERFVTEPLARAGEPRRDTNVFTQGEAQALAPLPDPAPVGGSTIVLAGLHPTLLPGDELIASGPAPYAVVAAGACNLVVVERRIGEARALPPGSTVIVCACTPLIESLYRFTVAMLDGFVGSLECPRDDLPFVLADDLDPAITAAMPRSTQAELVVVASASPADGVPPTTVLILQQPLAALYDRSRIVLYGNVVETTQGESVRDEVLGSGDGTVAFQSFALAQAPLASIAAADGIGIASTLQVRVNETLWQPVTRLSDAAATDEVYVLDVDGNGAGRVTFGNGIHGARLPTGNDNVTATYRVGGGPNGNLVPGSLTVPPAEVAGVSAVTNPGPATGGIGAAPRNALRRRIPESVQDLGRIISTGDYASFAVNFGGVAKAQAVPTPKPPSGKTDAPKIFVTIAGPGGSVPSPESSLFGALQAAMMSAAVPGSSFRLAAFEPRYFNVAADVLLDSRYDAALVLDEARQRLATRYGFERRDFGQAVTASRLVAQLQGIAGVVAVNLTALYDAAGPRALHPILVARPVRWEGAELLPAEILMINPDGIMLSAATP